MIRAVLIINNHGKPRLMKFFEDRTVDEQQQIIRECFQLLSKRSDHSCNFVEGGARWGKDTKLIYRHYATLYFIFCVDQSESELGILDLIQVFVETLDKTFENVCELDLIFHLDRVHFVLDEIVMGGMVLETNLPDILDAIKVQDQHEKGDSTLSNIKDVFSRGQR
eukprot:TRINITY_DN18404_c0_g1_i1.p2 TRINITY_DN18404_c0_g1~~TRINITY_DN18404_c0_g1_i1.p2  ORF type:complete len:166 (-),score=68.94 TRINITY_DN18404_c0_g1_i1:56-553(-)